MDVACQHCPSVYPISEQKLAGRLVRFRCKSCGNPIVVDGRQNPSRPPAAVTSVPPMSLGHLASSVAPQPAWSAPTPGVALSKQPSATPEAAQPAAPAPGPDATRVPRLDLRQSDKPKGPPPLPNGFDIDPNRAPFNKPAAALKSAPSAPQARALPSEPVPIRAASQPHNPHPQEVDPSVYEDETVAMTAMELEAAADAQSLPDSEPQVPEWYAPVLAASSGSTVLGVPAPPAFTPPPPPPPWNAAPHNTGNFTGTNPGVPNAIAAVNLQQPLTEGTSGPTPTSIGFDFDAPRPLRAESWSIGSNPPAPNPYATQDWRPQPMPSPPSGRTLASAEPPAQDNPWLFRGLLVVLGIGGVVLGGVLGNTWLRHVLPAPAPESGSDARTEIMNPDLPGFDALGANERLEAAQAEAVNCLNADTAPLTGLLVARFHPNGDLEALTMTGSVGSAPETPCIRSVFDKVKVPPFRGVTSQVEKAVELRPRP